ncbi:MAG TPA: hypothetical protein VFM99_04725 [Chitinophagales bacterium]|nr:hypothetical protein [Chitinophagales bacterium]
MTKATPYVEENAFSDFVVKAEQIMMDENQNWAKSHREVSEE